MRTARLLARACKDRRGVGVATPTKLELAIAAPATSSACSSPLELIAITDHGDLAGEITHQRKSLLFGSFSSRPQYEPRTTRGTTTEEPPCRSPPGPALQPDQTRPTTIPRYEAALYSVLAAASAEPSADPSAASADPAAASADPNATSSCFMAAAAA